ncbi:MAG: 3-oxoacyl-[acyl-carrier-protein] synthase III C-terminal domain-containing protein, partial [Bacillota bacterium]|nr:3-oxoacyl-[acyl-carrier-protein] synthase III C-terminal domain-containing protein [Bacillota bacterium]
KNGIAPAVTMDGKAVFRFAVDIVPKCMNDLLTKSGKTLDEVDYVICHQANERIIAHVYRKLKAHKEKFFVNLQEYGNTSSASIPLVLDEMNRSDLLKRGMNILCVGFGAGLSWGGVLFQW